MTRPFTTLPDFWKIEVRDGDNAATNPATLVAKSSLWAAELMVPLGHVGPQHILSAFDRLTSLHGHPDRVRLPWTSNCDALAAELTRRGVSTTRLFRFTPTTA